MNKKFTHNHLIKYIYRETSASETLATKEALNEDIELANEYNNLMDGYMELPKAKFNPSDATLQNILAYSERTAVETHFE